MQFPVMCGSKYLEKRGEKSRQEQMPMLGSAIYNSNKKRQLEVTLDGKITLCLEKV